MPLLVAFPITLALSGEPRVERTISSDGFTVEQYFGKPLVRSTKDLIADLNITVYPEDKLTIFPDPALGLGGRVTIIRATPVWINDAGRKTLVRTFAKTIGELFSEKGLVLGDKDTVEPGLETGLLAEGMVKVTRVEETKIIEKQVIAYKTITKQDHHAPIWVTRVEQEGRNGFREQTFMVRRENGIEVWRKPLSEKVISAPIDEVSLKGAKKILYGPWEQIIHEVAPRYFANPEGMIKLMYCESGGNAYSYNPAGPYYGLFQFHKKTFTGMGYLFDQIEDVRFQIEAAAKLYSARYWHWPVCSRRT